jgi:hypothetical protein
MSRTPGGFAMMFTMASPPGSRLRITVADDPDHLRSLLEWLRLEDELRGQVRLEAAHDPSGQQMGGVLDVLTVALGSGGAGAVLASSLSTWLTHRSSDVKITVTAPDGRRVEVDARRVRDVPALTRDVERLAHPPEPSR